jgi:hypothetical protein
MILKNIYAKKLEFLLKILLIYAKKLIMLLVFEKAHFLAENGGKSQKNVIITSTPGPWVFVAK